MSPTVGARSPTFLPGRPPPRLPSGLAAPPVPDLVPAVEPVSEREALVQRLTAIATGTVPATVAQVRASVALLDRLPAAEAPDLEALSDDELEERYFASICAVPADVLLRALAAKGMRVEVRGE